MKLAIKSQPKNATFLFRIGRFSQDWGLLEEAYDWFKKAKESDDTYFDARLSFASVAIDLGRLEEAREEISALGPKLTGEKRRILQNIEAKCELSIGNIDKACEVASDNLRRGRNVATIGLMVEIEIALSERCRSQGLEVMADSHMQRARELVDEGLQIEPNNPHLLTKKRKIETG